MPNYWNLEKGDALITSPFAEYRPGENVTLKSVTYQPWEDPEVETVTVKFADGEKRKYGPDDLVDVDDLLDLLRTKQTIIQHAQAKTKAEREARVKRNVELIQGGMIPVDLLRGITFAPVLLDWRSHEDNTLTLSDAGTQGRVHHEGRLTLELGNHAEDEGQYIQAIAGVLR